LRNRDFYTQVLERCSIAGYNLLMDLSIVIPAYEESKKIARDIKTAAAFLEGNHFTAEIIVVDDGSKDNTTETAKNVEIPADIKLNCIRYEQHRGKGYAVRRGINNSRGDFVVFADSGCCVPYEDTLRGLDLLKSGICDIAHGSRKMHGCHIEKAQSLYRRICSKIFHWFVIHDMKIPAEFTDTQCGFKVYKGDVARHLYGECITDGFTFDIEIIMRAQKEGYRIKEFPIDWTCDRDSRLSPTRNSWRVLTELLTIRKILSNK
ncbi:MAG: glycosyltransferase, partial [Planctomycetota bacterium]